VLYIRSRGFMGVGTPVTALLRRFWLGFIFGGRGWLLVGKRIVPEPHDMSTFESGRNTRAL